MGDEIKGYWVAYGGVVALVTSPFLWIAIIATALSGPFWLHDNSWVETSLDILPSLLGFSLGAMAIVLAFPATPLFKHLAEEGRKDSYYLQLSARFLHFIILQVAGILLALIDKVGHNCIVSYFGFFFLVYAILTAASTALSLFGVAQLYTHPAVSPIDQEGEVPSDSD